jgi:hypothetical protein
VIHWHGNCGTALVKALFEKMRKIEQAGIVNLGYFYLFMEVFRADGGQAQAVADRGLDPFPRDYKNLGSQSKMRVQRGYFTGFILPFRVDRPFCRGYYLEI